VIATPAFAEEPSSPVPPADPTLDMKLKRSLNTARAGAWLPVAGVAVFGSAVAAGFAVDDEDRRAGLVTAGFMLGFPAIVLGPPLLAGGSMRAARVLEWKGKPVSRTAGWVAWGCFGTMMLLPSLVSTEESMNNDGLVLGVEIAEGALLLASYGAGLGQLKLDLDTAGLFGPGASVSILPTTLPGQGGGIAMVGAF
jgi:hypothetical protein